METHQGAGNNNSGSVFPSQKVYKATKIVAPLLILSALFIGWNYYDVMWWVRWYRIVEGYGAVGLLNIYELCKLPDCKAPYPPLAILVFVSIYATVSFLPVYARPVILKLLLVLIPGLVVYKTIAKLRGKDVALVWLVSIPFLQILFALQFDAIVACMILLSVCMLLEGKINRSALVLGLATTIKHVAAIVLPLYLLALKFKKGGVEDVCRFILVYLVCIGSIILPFFVSTPREFVEHVLLFHSLRAPQDLTFWALPSIILGNAVSSVQSYIDNLWFFFFLACYTALVALFYLQVKRYGLSVLHRLLPLCTSIVLLLYITMNKIGNLNYLVWFVPTALLALNKKHIKTLYTLTSAIGLGGALTYAFMLYIPPASVNAPMFIVEDLAYWNARALIAQSINYYIFYIATFLQSVFIYIVSSAYTPTDFVSEVPIFRILYIYRSAVVIASLVLTQVLLTVLLVMKINWVKEYTVT